MLEQERDEKLTDREKAFYEGLFRNLEQDWQDVYDETVENDERYGKDDDESGNLWEITDKVRTYARDEGMRRLSMARKAKKV